jgi:hypothetical protein
VTRRILEWLRSWFRTEIVAVPQCGDATDDAKHPAPQCGRTDDFRDNTSPQCGDGSGDAIEPTPQCGLARAAVALDEIEQEWKVAADAPHCGDRNVFHDARDLALQFRRCLQSKPALIGYNVASSWIRSAYPTFCKVTSAGVAPPFKDFANQLKTVMRRARKEKWKQGKRIGTATWYLVSDPADSVVDLAAAERRRA